jgi:hypothetical protein
VRVLALVLMSIFAAQLAGCAAERDPAAEPPIAMKGGVYSVDFDASAFGMVSPVPLNDAKAASRTCVRFNEGDGWIYKAIREHITAEPECQTVKSKRTGNAITGSVACQLPQSEGGGVLALDYSGVVSEEGVDLTGTIRPPEDRRGTSLSEEEEVKLRLLLQVMDLSIKIQRVGDC